MRFIDWGCSVQKDWEAQMAELRRKLAEQMAKYEAQMAELEAAKASALRADQEAEERRRAEEAYAHDQALEAMKVMH